MSQRPVFLKRSVWVFFIIVKHLSSSCNPVTWRTCNTTSRTPDRGKGIDISCIIRSLNPCVWRDHIDISLLLSNNLRDYWFLIYIDISLLLHLSVQTHCEWDQLSFFIMSYSSRSMTGKDWDLLTLTLVLTCMFVAVVPPPREIFHWSDTVCHYSWKMTEATWVLNWRVLLWKNKFICDSRVCSWMMWTEKTVEAHERRGAVNGRTRCPLINTTDRCYQNCNSHYIEEFG